MRTFCRYYEDDPLLAEIEIDFAFGKGERAIIGQYTCLPLFCGGNPPER